MVSVAFYTLAYQSSLGVEANEDGSMELKAANSRNKLKAVL